MPEVRIEGVDALWAGWRHEGDAADLVRALKYGRVTAAVTPIADRMALVLAEARDGAARAGAVREGETRSDETWAEEAQRAGLLTWVPCSPTRRRQRGFDPAELLARALARRLRIRARRLLQRLDDEPQTARTLHGRLAGPRLAPTRRALAAGRRRRAGPVLVVDDVCTTGSTLRAAAAALRAGGAAAVVAAVATVAPAASDGTSTIGAHLSSHH